MLPCSDTVTKLNTDCGCVLVNFKCEPICLAQIEIGLKDGLRVSGWGFTLEDRRMKQVRLCLHGGGGGGEGGWCTIP